GVDVFVNRNALSHRDGEIAVGAAADTEGDVEVEVHRGKLRHAARFLNRRAGFQFFNPAAWPRGWSTLGGSGRDDGCVGGAGLPWGDQVGMMAVLVGNVSPHRS